MASLQHRMTVAAIGTLLFLQASPKPLAAAVIIWNGGVDMKWETAGNWNLNRIPDNNNPDDVQIGGDKGTITLKTPGKQVKSLKIAASTAGGANRTILTNEDYNGIIEITTVNGGTVEVDEESSILGPKQASGGRT